MNNEWVHFVRQCKEGMAHSADNLQLVSWMSKYMRAPGKE
jgi:hypothetical protein